MQDKNLHKVELIFDAIKKYYKLRTYRELSEFLGVKEGTLNAWKARNNIGDVDVFLTKCKGINYEWLRTGQGEMFISEPLKDSARSEGQITDEFSFVPLYNVELAAGHGTLVESERVTSRYAFRKEWVRKISSSPGSLALCLVKGDSMNPTLRDGDIVMIDTNRKTLSLNGIYSINLGGLAAVKRLEMGLKDKIRIISDNVAEYPTYEADLSDIIIIGQVVWYARELVKPANGNGGF
ncbi:LexA family transcriptional regulator [Desulforegula conservatrix]|uniref:LexA family transcriptional regulator n=1 Tax=Desulforegula conservatrix TaxID=153026 RepID=UPI000684C60A|nr:helix-turn-helix transcriptional regulator [Desulforegula conservatrix]